MKCPACANALSVKSVANIQLDVCDNGCGGIWFDQFEFKKFDEKNEPDAESILHLNVLKQAPPSNQLDCPKCQSQKMMRHFSSVKKRVSVDECPKCAGVWLDAGELTQIRGEFGTEDERKKAAEDFFSDAFGVDMKHEHEKSMRKLEMAKKFAVVSRLFKRS